MLVKNAGAAHVYQHTDSAWVEHTKLLASATSAGNHFGQAVAVHDDVVVVGAGSDHGGAAYVFRWEADQRIADGDGDCDDLGQLLAHYGISEGASYEDGDLDGDSDVHQADLALLLAMYGIVCR